MFTPMERPCARCEMIGFTNRLPKQFREWPVTMPVVFGTDERLERTNARACAQNPAASATLVWRFSGPEMAAFEAGGAVGRTFVPASRSRHSSSYLTTSLCKSWPMKKTMNRMALKGLRKPHAIALPGSVKLVRKSPAETARIVFRNVVIFILLPVDRCLSAREQFEFFWVLTLPRFWRKSTIFCQDYRKNGT